jgi:hypothetical protein
LTDSKRKTKRKVDLVGSHSDNENENRPLAACNTKVSSVSELYKNDGIPTFLRYLLSKDKAARENSTLPTVLDKLVMVANINTRKLIEVIKTKIKERGDKNPTTRRND